MNHRAAVLFVLLNLFFLMSGCASYTRSMIWENKIKLHHIEQTTKAQIDLDEKNIELEAVRLGHATVLLRLGDQWLITDPVLHDRIGPPELFNNAFGIKRRKALPIALDDLPPIDAVLISHAHYDHLDLPSLRSLISLSKPTLIIPRGVRELVDKLEANTVELDWLASNEKPFTTGSMTITPFRVEHYGHIPWGKRKKWTGFNGYLIKQQNLQVLFFGDTSYQRYRDEYGKPLKKPQKITWRDKFTLAEIHQGFDLCIIPIGDSYFHHNHTTPEEAAHLALELNCKKMLPIHYETFRLSPKEPKGQDARTRLVDYLKKQQALDLLSCGNDDNRYPEIGQRCILINSAARYQGDD
ncbi:MAG: MBL fold metallo-hydrolase [Thiotrichales bacterium]